MSDTNRQSIHRLTTISLVVILFSGYYRFIKMTSLFNCVKFPQTDDLLGSFQTTTTLVSLQTTAAFGRYSGGGTSEDDERYGRYCLDIHPLILWL